MADKFDHGVRRSPEHGTVPKKGQPHPVREELYEWIDAEWLRLRGGGSRI